eukprot:5386835-Alexandrium_andersonii.AAC.1
MAGSPHGRGLTPSTDVHWGPLKAAPKRAPNHGRQRSDRATWGATSWRPKLLRRSIFAHSTAPNWGGSEGP